jgi:pimeloyl-ACP methyl ester carboxylesterase
MTEPLIGASGDYVDLAGVKTWHQTIGSGPPLVLLHGGLGASIEWEPHAPALSEHFTVHVFDRRAHGRSGDPGPLSYALMADDAIAFLDEVVGGPAHLVGWSDGGNVALMVASRRPDLAHKLVIIGSNIRPDGVPEELAQGFVAMPANAPDFMPLRTMHAGLSPDGEAHWPVLLEKLKRMIISEVVLGSAKLADIAAPTLVVSGDDDMVTIEHSVEIYRGIPNAQLAIIPGASHFAHLEKPELVTGLIMEFLRNEPGPTMMPIRRAGGEASPV